MQNVQFVCGSNFSKMPGGRNLLVKRHKETLLVLGSAAPGTPSAFVVFKAIGASVQTYNYLNPHFGPFRKWTANLVSIVPLFGGLVRFQIDPVLTSV